MVFIAKKDFNLELDKYIDSRRGEDSSFSKTLSKVKKSFSGGKTGFSWPSLGLRNAFRRKIPDDVAVKKKQPEEEFGKMEDELESIQEVEDELEEERENVLKRFFRKLWSSNRKESEEEVVLGEEEQQASTDEEVREVLKGLHKWLESLPPKKKAEFKGSGDFERYKELLEKLGMIK